MRTARIIVAVWIGCFLLIFLRFGTPAALFVLLFTVLYGVTALVLSRVTGKALRAEIKGGALVEKGAPLTESLRLTNQGRLPVFLGEAELLVANRLTGREERRWIPFSLWPGGEKTVGMEVKEDLCGRIDVTLSRVRISDPLRLFGKMRSLACGDTGYVAPAIGHVEIPAEYLDAYNMESYQYSQYEKGNDNGEVFGIREYREGDSQKQIHWKLSAKMDDLMVKIPSYPIENNILLLLDTLLVPGTAVEPARKSRLLDLFWSLSSTLLEKDMPHSVGWYDSGSEGFRLEPVRDREDLWNVLPETLGCGFEESEYSSIYRYLEMMGDKGFSNHFYVTAQEERDIERLENYGAVKVFREGE